MEVEATKNIHVMIKKKLGVLSYHPEIKIKTMSFSISYYLLQSLSLKIELFKQQV